MYENRDKAQLERILLSVDTLSSTMNKVEKNLLLMRTILLEVQTTTKAMRDDDDDNLHILIKQP